MARNHKHRIYLFALFGKASNDFSFIEVISEVIGGFMFAVIMLFTGAWDTRSATEDIFECVGCAVFVPVVAFILRLVFAAPAELVKESGESNVNPKSVYPSVITVLLAVGAFLALGLVFSVRFNFERAKEIAKPNPSPPNFLFTKVDPPSEPPTPMAAQMPALASSQVEAFAVPTNNSADIDTMEAQMKADNDSQQAQEDWRRNATEQAAWVNSYPYYHKALIELHDQLHELSKVDMDGLDQPENYFDLPKSVDQKVDDFPLTHIGLQNNTNMEFMVSISRWFAGEGRNLIIACPAGVLSLSVNYPYAFNGWLRLENTAPYIKCVRIQDADALTRYEINALIKAQWRYSQTLITNSIASEKSTMKTINNNE